MMPGKVYRGFTINEVLVSLALLIIFFFVAGNIFKSTVVLSAAGAQATDRAARTDSALFQLRGDVWNASRLRAADNRTVDVTTASGDAIRWHFGTEGITRTAAGQASGHWPDVCGNCSVTATRSYLDISDGGVPVRLSGPLLLSNR
jgi:hypothetical protein